MAQSPWRIAVTGIGLVTPLGLTAQETVRRVLRNETGIANGPDSEGVALACVPAFDLTKMLRNPKNLKLMSRPVRMGLLAVREAFVQSGLESGAVASDRLGVYVGSGQTGTEYDEFFKALTLAWEGDREMDFKHLGGMPSRVLDRYFSLRTLANAGVAAISTEFGARGSNSNYVQSESAPAVALYNACQDLLEERCDAAIVCGYDSLVITSSVTAFRNVGLLSEGGWSASYTPFGMGRSGIVLGEGAGCLVLERRASSDARGVETRAEIEGVGLASQIADTPGWTAGADDLACAAQEASQGMTPDFVMARGLGMEADDLAEARALGEFLPADVPVAGIKGNTGYLGAATAAVELGVGILCARQRSVPAVFGSAESISGFPLSIVRGAPARLTAAEPRGLFFSSSMGGQVAAIAARAVGCADD